MEENKIIVGNIKRLCLERGISVSKMAKEVGISKATMSHWKSGKCSPSYSNLCKIADYFFVSPGYLTKEHRGFTKDDETRVITNAEDVFGYGAGELLRMYSKMPTASRAMAISIMRLVSEIATMGEEEDGRGENRTNNEQG